MNDIWLFQAFEDEVYTHSDSEALLQAVRSKIIKQSRKNARNPYLIFGCSCQCVSPSLENTKELLKKWEWTNEQIKQGIDFATIDVYQNFVYLHIPNKIIKEYKTPAPHNTIKKIRGISRFISKLDYVDILIKRCWMKADLYKLEPGTEWDEFIAKGNTGDFYELKLMAYHISCTCHAYRGIEKAFLQDTKAQNYLINHEIAQGQIPDKHTFAVWKYLGADNYTQYQYCWIERRDKALKYYQWEFQPEEDEVLAS